MNRTKEYHDVTKEFRKALSVIWDNYDKKMQSLEQYKGSNGYNDDKAKAEKERDIAVYNTQQEYKTKFNEIIQGMRKSATSRSMIPPTAEQIALLQVLKMRENITRDELEQAGRTLKDCPAALSVLQEIATQQQLYGLRFTYLSTAGVLDSINTLADSAKRMCTMSKPNSRRNTNWSVHSPDYEPGTSKFQTFRIDKDTDSVRESMELFGGVIDLSSFESAVND